MQHIRRRVARGVVHRPRLGRSRAWPGPTRCSSRVSFLQTLSAGQAGEPAVECAKRQVAGLPRHLQDEAVGEPHRRTAAKMLEGRGDQVAVLDRQVPVVEQHVHGHCRPAGRPA